MLQSKREIDLFCYTLIGFSNEQYLIIFIRINFRVYQQSSNIAQLMNGKPCFIEDMRQKLLQYQVQKIREHDAKTEQSSFYKKEVQAKLALIDLENEDENSKIIEEDMLIGRWSNYKIPSNFEERLISNKMPLAKNNYFSQNKKNKLELQRESHCLIANCQSQRNIPQLKNILQLLETPMQRKINKVNLHKDIIQREQSRKVVQSIQPVLIPMNRAELKPSNQHSKRNIASSQRHHSSGSANKKNCENSNPLNEKGINNLNLKLQLVNNYQKIKRRTGTAQSNNYEGDPINEKQILSQLIKGNLTKQSNTISALSNMSNYFSLNGGNDKKRKISLKLNDQ